MMPKTSTTAASRGIASHDDPSIATAGFGQVLTSTSSHSSGGFDDYRILQPDDFRRVKSQLSMRSRPSSRIGYAIDSDSPHLAASASKMPDVVQDALPMPPDFDLVIQSRPRDLVDRAGRDRATFGSWNEDSEGSDEDNGVAPTDPKEELVSIADEGSDSESVLPIEGSAERGSEPALSGASSSLIAEDAHLSQLKQEAEEVWAKYRPGMAPQQSTLALESDFETSSTGSDQPAHIPQRLTSLHRSSLIVLTALPKADLAQRRGSIATLSSNSHTSSIHEKGFPSGQSTKLESETLPRIPTRLSRGSLSSWRSPPPSDVHFQRPYTASILSSTSDGSFLSFQNSFESGMSPLLLNCSASSSRLPGRILRPATSGSIPNTAFTTDNFNYSRPLFSGSTNRPETRNQLTPEERRQQVRRTKKLTQMLGEEMLLASNAASVGSDLAQRSHSSGTGADNRRKKYRPQSMPFNTEYPGSTGSKTLALSRKLLQSRSHGVKSCDHAFSELEQPVPSAPAGLNRKAAAILGIPHPYSSSALSRVSGEEMLENADLDLVDGINLSTRPLVPSGLEGFNEPTPKVAQLAAFSSAALDEGASPTLPQDGSFRPFDRSHLDQAMAMSESLKLAAARDERRRRIAKMSRWLGEAVPAELIKSAAHKPQSAVIRSTRTPVTSHQTSTSHDSGNTADEISSMYRPQSSACHASSNGHGSLSHEGSVSSNLRSFMSIDSSDDESDSEAAPVNGGTRGISCSPTEQRSVAPSPPSTTPALHDSLSAYLNSIDSYEYLLENNHERLSELASIFHGARITLSSATIDTVIPRTQPPRPSARPRTSPPATFNPATAHRSLVSKGNSAETQTQILRASFRRAPRRSAAFLELSDSESDSSDADELHEGDDLSCYSSSLRQKRLSSHDRSISKLSNFFGSTPSQIVRSQSDFRAIASSADSVSTVNHKTVIKSKVSQPDALKTILKSLEEEALDDSELTSFQKSEISRRVNLLKKRTTKMFA